jgi:hypothetical protein
VTLVAADFGESMTIKGLAEKLAPEFDCKVFAGEGKIPSPFSNGEIETAIAASDIVVIAVSENTAIEVFAGECAIKHQKPLVLVALFYNTWKRSDFEQFRKYAKVLFVLDEAEAEIAKMLYPKTLIIATGNPDWETFAFPKRTREEVRSILKLGEEEKFILVSGEKEMGVNVPLAVNVIEAVAVLDNPRQYKIIFTIHPGHVPLPGGADLIEFYKELEQYDPRVWIRFSCKATPFGIGTPDMVVGADVVIGTNSTVQIQAAYLRIPAIAVLLRRAFRGVELPEKQRYTWPPCSRGAVDPVSGLDSKRTESLIQELLQPEVAAYMHKAQKESFPTPDSVGQAYETMKEWIRKI